MKLVLGSASPRRRELLHQINIHIDDVRVADIDETPMQGELPLAYVVRMAREKALTLPINLDECILSADTIVCFKDMILGKPKNKSMAVEYLSKLQGNAHQVHSAICVRTNTSIEFDIVSTEVVVRSLNYEEINAYVAMNEWEGKAGGYAIQGIASSFIPKINGSYSNVVGLPLSEVTAMLARHEVFPNRSFDV